MKKTIYIILAIGMFFGCEDFEDWNVDETNPSSVPASYLVTNAEKNLFTTMTSTSVNYNIFKLFAQYWNETQYTDEVNYDIRGRDIGGNFFLYLYRDVLNDLQEAKRLIDEDITLSSSYKSTQSGVLEVLEVYTWHVLVDTYGNIPYTESLLGVDNLTPVYDDDSEIYNDLFARLDNAIVQLNADSESFGSADLIYNGSTAQWIKFANSLKLKMAVRISDYDQDMAQQLASEAVSQGVLTSNTDNASFPFETAPPNTNPVWTSLVQSGRNDFVVANTFVDIISPLNDPRASVFMDDNVFPYEGGIYGTGSSYTDFTHIGDAWHTPDLEGIILSYDEVQFLLAEAVERGLVSGNAESFYQEGIRASITYWGGAQEDIDAYLAQSEVAYNAGNWKESIGVQKYIALYGRGFEAWSTWRLLDYPNTFIRPVISGEPVPRRYLYGNDEGDVNSVNYEAASTAMGGDLKSSRVFWDIVGQGN
ncbi:SusD/RagB family nutrient-binding outer membrane lipoprotein [Muricauda sp. 334s03]|uniref:SusD/RagB family nutrient-binding outer membrane lipoprotein n=1 Tax=Flagellimonas yonaguniensis TaxID=3031325 RepID=A0ABT5Y125_9FLAO|nr:SusD/RagB family nutrient-binding outer membrane lipoprotein [[Muricauda] yonaguniensis]MDF0717154.1 SusD/RagB family nutrient-binding outer membrane lipoprotein [[Muricauda] yonaguniensis]